MSPSNLHLSSCTSNVDCSRVVLQISGGRVVERWSYVSVSIDSSDGGLNMGLKMVYLDSA